MDAERTMRRALFWLWFSCLLTVIAIWVASGEAAVILFSMVLLALLTVLCLLIFRKGT